MSRLLWVLVIYSSLTSTLVVYTLVNSFAYHQESSEDRIIKAVNEYKDWMVKEDHKNKQAINDLSDFVESENRRLIKAFNENVR